ncbi:hypothetical protein DL766_004078 [Monosporascus sp. MC13-8B]|uniref:Uncharacterized protein n=1 Tax=Monosporascus cannonballus TaxID=155416 RepID=A0ABY0HC20_9PEZI|nr:hypothetical protein DL762_003107 [Monosporascus cannonballus]RYO99111.1 hypothetical protein DL763_001712 [Monosporascus cannonballus]RYP32238.1 hypothetical protein DL766_004078 [Monosporascus sp. MC13-8B]
MSALSMITIPPNTVEQLKLLAAAGTFAHPVAGRCLLLACSGGVVIAWPSTVAKLIGSIGGIAVTKESGFSYRGGTTGFVGIIQSAAAGRAPGISMIRKVGYAVTAVSVTGGLFATQWRRLVGLFKSLRRKAGKEGKQMGKESSKEKKERKEQAASSSAAPSSSLPPSSSRVAPYAVTSPPQSELEQDSDGEFYRKASKSRRDDTDADESTYGRHSSRSKRERKDKERKHRK